VSDVRGKTGRPFALNLWLPTDDGAQDINVPESDGSAAALRPIFDELGLPLPARPDQYLPSFEEQI
jgi:nitronate monooxygenase